MNQSKKNDERTCRMYVRVEERLHTRIKSMAKEQGVSVSELLNQILAADPRLAETTRNATGTATK